MIRIKEEKTAGRERDRREENKNKTNDNSDQFTVTKIANNGKEKNCNFPEFQVRVA